MQRSLPTRSHLVPLSTLRHMLRLGLHVRVNFRECYRKHLVTTFTRESKSWLADSLRSLLRVPELAREQEHGGGRVS
jgi:hypothetical protein